MSESKRPAIFLDRDGVIIENREEYVRSWAEVTFIPGALSALAAMVDGPYAMVVVTNQASIGRGLIPLAEVEAINHRVLAEIARAGGRVDAAYICPHKPEDDCDCRKPRPGMLLRAARELNLDLTHSWMIGDALTDMQAGEAAGVRALLVLTGRGVEHQTGAPLDGREPFLDLPAALAFIRSQTTDG